MSALVVLGLGLAAVACLARARRCHIGADGPAPAAPTAGAPVAVTATAPVVGDIGTRPGDGGDGGGVGVGRGPGGGAGGREVLVGTGAPAPGALGRWWAGALADAGVGGDAARWGRVALAGLGVLVLAALVRGGPTGAGVTVAVAGAAAVVGRQASSGRGARLADARLPELVEHVARGLRAGHDLRGAALAAGDVVGGVHGAELVAVVGRVDGGARWPDALQGWLDAHPRRPVELVVGALRVAEAAGGAAGSALDGVAATLRARSAAAHEARSLASQARASAAVLVGLPVVVAVGGAAADRKVADALLGTPWGIGCIALAILLDGAGALWMHRIVTGARS